MASHSSILTWKIPWARDSGGLQVEPGGLQALGSQRVGDN